LLIPHNSLLYPFPPPRPCDWLLELAPPPNSLVRRCFCLFCDRCSVFTFWPCGGRGRAFRFTAFLISGALCTLSFLGSFPPFFPQLTTDSARGPPLLLTPDVGRRGCDRTACPLLCPQFPLRCPLRRLPRALLFLKIGRLDFRPFFFLTFIFVKIPRVLCPPLTTASPIRHSR